MPTSAPKSRHSGRIIRVISHMGERLERPIRLEEMAAIANLSPFHFDRIFRDVTGLSAAAFQAALRLQHAKSAILMTTRSIVEISTDLGYESVGSFTTRFTRAVGVSPRTLRKGVSALRDRDVAAMFHDRARARVVNAAHAAVTVTFASLPAPGAIVWIGLFAKGIPDGVPVAGTMASGTTTATLARVPPGSYRCLAAAYQPSANILDYLLSNAHAKISTPTVEINASAEPVNLRLTFRTPAITDPPVLLAMPLQRACGANAVGD